MIDPEIKHRLARNFQSTQIISLKYIQDLFHDTWLESYPWPQFINFDNGGEFKREFKQMCLHENYGIEAKPNTNHNITQIC
jgi:hypothetical protein